MQPLPEDQMTVQMVEQGNNSLTPFSPARDRARPPILSPLSPPPPSALYMACVVITQHNTAVSIMNQGSDKEPRHKIRPLTRHQGLCVPSLPQ